MRHVIIGNGPAGVTAAETLRKYDEKAEIVMIGKENVPAAYSRMAIPYWLSGDIGEDGTYLRRSKDHFQRLNIKLVNQSVRSIDTQNHSVQFDSGQGLSFDQLLIASGAKPMKPKVAGVDLDGVHYCWTLEDARNILAQIRLTSRVLQIGAGFIACTIMEAMVKRCKQLTLVELGNRMVPRMMTQTAGDLIAQWCQQKGVAFIPNARVESIQESTQGLVAAFDNGKNIEADLIIVATGVVPHIEFLQNSGIECSAGVHVNHYLQTNVANVYAAGDVVEMQDPLSKVRTLNMTQPNAVDQGRVAALNMLGKHTEFEGLIAINVLDTLGLVSASLGLWEGVKGGDHVEHADAEAYKYLRLEFAGDYLVGATALGLTENLGVLKGLIQGRVNLSQWKQKLLKEPLLFNQAYLDCALSQSKITH